MPLTSFRRGKSQGVKEVLAAGSRSKPRSGDRVSEHVHKWHPRSQHHGTEEASGQTWAKQTRCHCGDASFTRHSSFFRRIRGTFPYDEFHLELLLLDDRLAALVNLIQEVFGTQGSDPDRVRMNRGQ